MPKPYPREFRDDVVRVARDREAGVTVEQTAKDCGVHPMTLFTWLRQTDVDAGAGPGNRAGSARMPAPTACRLAAGACHPGGDPLDGIDGPPVLLRLPDTLPVAGTVDVSVEGASTGGDDASGGVRRPRVPKLNRYGPSVRPRLRLLTLSRWHGSIFVETPSAVDGIQDESRYPD
ncbi:transposase [Micromonospora aurantiaca (nom. illeg.)]|uniref:transposase n=1 Tax=Micromonospora aurantiaca (nom. illeg.) TaxID=47850 RepID=UPI0033D48040